MTRIATRHPGALPDALRCGLEPLPAGALNRTIEQLRECGEGSTVHPLDVAASAAARLISREAIKAETEIRLGRHGCAKAIYADLKDRINMIMGELA